MWLLMVEAGVALFLLVFIVWWTMYQGQPRKPEVPTSSPDKARTDSPASDATPGDA